jgi:hypothetical protein
VRVWRAEKENYISRCYEGDPIICLPDLAYTYLYRYSELQIQIGPARGEVIFPVQMPQPRDGNRRKRSDFSDVGGVQWLAGNLT